MDFEQLKELIYFLQGTNVSKISLKHGEFSVDIQMKDNLSSSGRPANLQAAPQYVQAAPVVMEAAPVVAVAPVAPVVQETPKAVVEQAPAKEAKSEVKYLEIKSPMVGTFYRSPSPDKPAFVKVGDTITADSPVCLIEAMKLFNEVKAEISGRIVKVVVEDSSPVEYEQVLFLVEPV